MGNKENKPLKEEKKTSLVTQDVSLQTSKLDTVSSQQNLSDPPKKLIKKDFDPMELDSSLWFAANNGNLVKIKKGIQGGTNVNARDKNGDSMIIAACRSSKDNSHVVEFLINIGADPNLQNNDRNSPLHEAASRGHVNCMKVLLKGGADPNLKNSISRNNKKMI